LLDDVQAQLAAHLDEAKESERSARTTIENLSNKIDEVESELKVARWQARNQLVFTPAHNHPGPTAGLSGVNEELTGFIDWRASQGSSVRKNAESKQLAQEEKTRQQAITDLAQRESEPLSRELEELRARFAQSSAMNAELTKQLRKAEKKLNAQRSKPKETEKSPWQRLFGKPSDNAPGSSNGPSPDASSKKITSPYTFWIDGPKEPSLEGQAITVSGWLFGREGVKYRRIRATTSEQSTVGRYGLERPDVAAAFPEEKDARHVGFEIQLELPVGRHEISLQITSGVNQWETFCTFQHDVLKAGVSE
jgi:hypothetical protein